MNVMNCNSNESHTDETLASLKVGEATIDEEHENLFRLLKTLREAPPGRGPGGFGDVLSAFGSVLMAHCEHEESFFKKLAMPEALVQSHLRSHREIVHQYAELCLALIEDDGIDRESILAMIQEWIVYHLIQHDLKMRPYVEALAQA